MSRATKMIGSWAGAMGQPQFMPSNFGTLAVDFDRRRPQGHLGQRAGRAGVDREFPQALGLEGRRRLGPRGRRAASRSTIAAAARAIPNGPRSASRAPTASRCRAPATRSCSFRAARPARRSWSAENFEVIKRYNNSDVFALAVSHLADRARGAAPFRARWPAVDRQLSRGRTHRVAEAAEGARPHGERLRGADRFRSAGRDPARAGEARDAAGRTSDARRCWRRSGRSKPSP